MAQRRDRVVVEAFVSHLGASASPGLVVDAWLEDENPGQSVVEALAGPFAIEHTSIDTFAGQRQIAHRFSEVVTPLERVLTPHLSGVLRGFLPDSCFQTGEDWGSLQEALARWVVSEGIGLPEGATQTLLPDVGVSVRAFKDSRFRPRLVFWLESGDEPPLAVRLRAQVVRKAAKVSPHADSGKTRVLLLESVDSVNMGPGRLLDALVQAFGGMPPGVDQLWFVDGTTGLRPEFHDLTSELLAGKSAA